LRVSHPNAVELLASYSALWEAAITAGPLIRGSEAVMFLHAINTEGAVRLAPFPPIPLTESWINWCFSLIRPVSEWLGMM
jgi:hypothetical protein